MTHDGTSEEALHSTRRALPRRRLPALASLAKAALLAALRFLAEAEDAPTALLDRYIGKEEMMNSPFLRELFREQEARARKLLARIRAAAPVARRARSFFSLTLAAGSSALISLGNHLESADEEQRSGGAPRPAERSPGPQQRGG